eukprot:UN23100
MKIGKKKLLIPKRIVRDEVQKEMDETQRTLHYEVRSIVKSLRRLNRLPTIRDQSQRFQEIYKHQLYGHRVFLQVITKFFSDGYGWKYVAKWADKLKRSGKTDYQSAESFVGNLILFFQRANNIITTLNNPYPPLFIIALFQNISNDMKNDIKIRKDCSIMCNILFNLCKIECGNNGKNTERRILLSSFEHNIDWNLFVTCMKKRYEKTKNTE